MKTYLMNLKMSRKLLLSPLSVMILLFIFGIMAYIGLATQKSAINDIYNNRFQAYKNCLQIMNNLTDAHANTYKLLSWTNANYDSKRIEDLGKEQMDKIDKTITYLDSGIKSGKLTKDENKYYSTVLNLVSDYKTTILKVIEMATADYGLATTLMTPAEEKFEALNKNLKELLELENKLSKESYGFSIKVFYGVIIIMAAVMIVAIALSLIISIYMTKLILTPIKQTIEVIEDIAQGDLTKRVDIFSSDEIGEMANHFNNFVDTLHKTIINVSESSDKVASASNTLDTSVEQMAAAVEQAATQVNSVATASEEMSTTSSEIAQNCVMVAKSAEKANTSAVTGEKIIHNNVSTMNHVREIVRQSAQINQRLGERSDQIGTVVGLINDIADQTNLLALNAAIEAARAGEHGRGFAVVADEVRKLAERTTEATKEIANTIQAMQSETKSAVASMEQGVKEVEKGSEEAKKSGDAIKDILEQIGAVTAEVNQIAVASEQQTATTNEIANNIQQISEVMQQTARNIQGNADASAQLAALSKRLQEVIGQFRI